jgi:metal-responsive CopG/Arc/MetJ family transcriptional regulator
MGNDYITVSLPKTVIEKIDMVIEESDLGYKSRPEFVKDAIRRRFEDLEINCVEGLNSGG